MRFTSKNYLTDARRGMNGQPPGVVRDTGVSLGALPRTRRTSYIDGVRRSLWLRCKLGLVLLLALGCSSSHSAVSNPCALLTRAEVARAIGGRADVGKREHAIGEKERRICSYAVSTSVRTVTVYLGRGHPEAGTGVDAGGATESRGAVYVSIGAQYPDKNFPPVALRLARKAITRAPSN